mgnify:CR=1 FL=1|tara:strand:+ start:6710 stop:7978 length:1269 start_codon:yes stop_codon:yes gene_type:complete
MQTFEAQVEALTSLSIDGSSAPTQTELSDFLSDGAIDVINSMPPRLKYMCATEDTFTSVAVGSESKVLKSGNILSVTREGEPCREIPADRATRASDSSGIASSHMEVATATDPVFYIYNGMINALPASGACKYLEINRPSVSYSHDSMDDSVASFPLEYEYLVPLYASVKALQNAMAAKSADTDITTALTAVKTAVGNAGTEIGLAKTESAEIATFTDTAAADSNMNTAVDAINTAADKFRADNDAPALFGDSSQYTSGEGLAKVKTALDRAISYINADFPSANYDLAANLLDIDTQLENEDTELAASRVQQAQTTISAIQTDISLAQAHIADWNAAIGALQAEINSFSGEVSSRVAVVSSKSQAVQSYLGTASNFLSQAAAFSTEVQTRLSVATTEYSWMEKQQAKLQDDYNKGIQKMVGG